MSVVVVNNPVCVQSVLQSETMILYKHVYRTTKLLLSNQAYQQTLSLISSPNFLPALVIVIDKHYFIVTSLLTID